jgi:chromate transporter
LAHFLEITWVANAFQGIKAAVAFLIFSAGWKMFRKMKKNKVELCVFAGSLLAMLLVNLKLVNFSAIYLILISAVIGLIRYRGKNIEKNQGGTV